MDDALIPPHEIPPVQGLDVPRQFYQVLALPAPLAGMAYPNRAVPWSAIAAAGFRHVVRLTGIEALYNPAPLRVLWAEELEDLIHGAPPHDPQAEQRLVEAAVNAILPRLAAGEGVVVHCAGGTGRTGTVIGCVLRALGFPAERVLGYLSAVNRRRGNAGWPESAWQAQVVRDFQTAGRTGPRSGE